MNKGSFFILALMVGGICMILRVFFGGGNESEPIQDEAPGIINQLVNTGDIQLDSGNNSITISEKTGNQLPDEILEIKVTMPRYFYNSGRKKFAQDLYTQQKIYIKFDFIDNLNIYRSLLSDNNFYQTDLILLPYDWIENIQLRTFTFQQNLDSVFDPLISTIVGSNSIKFLPFSADPVIMYTLSGYQHPSNFSEVFEFVSNRAAKNPLYFPIFFGITSEDYDNKGFLREYQDIIRYSLMHYFTTYRDDNSLGKWIDSNVFENYNINNLNTILSAISNDSCEDFPSICFQLYNFAAIRFGFLSDADIVRQYFSNKKSNFINSSKEPIIFSTLESPVRIWGWVIPNSLQDVKTINAVYTFLVYYMNNHDKYDLWNSTLPVFTGNTRLFDNIYIGLRGYILQTGGDFIDNAKKQKFFWQLIEYQISAKDYLKKV